MAGRTCTVCNWKGKLGVPALYVARGKDAGEWFECGEHEPNDNVVEVERVALVPIAEWFARYGLSVPE